MKDRPFCRDPIGEEGGINLYGYVSNNPVNAVDPLGLDVYVGQHSVVGIGNHMAIVLSPNNPSDFANIDLFKGKDMATLGGQPSNKSSVDRPWGNLVSSPNNPGDAPCKLKDLTRVPTPEGMTDTEFINALINAAASYKDNLEYRPLGNPNYNSNGYVAGVLKKAGASAPNLPGWQPGAEHPIWLP